MSYVRGFVIAVLSFDADSTNAFPIVWHENKQPKCVIADNFPFLTLRFCILGQFDQMIEHPKSSSPQSVNSPNKQTSMATSHEPTKIYSFNVLKAIRHVGILPRIITTLFDPTTDVSRTRTPSLLRGTSNIEPITHLPLASAIHPCLFVEGGKNNSWAWRSKAGKASADNRWSALLAFSTQRSGPAPAGAGPNARPRRGAPLSSNFMTSSCSFSRAIRPW